MHIILILMGSLIIFFIYRTFFKSYVKDMQKSMKITLVDNLDYFLGDGINSIDQNGWTPLHIACFIGETEITKLLLEKGADTEIKNINDETPLV